MARKRKGLLSCLLSLLPRDPYQKCEREGGWDVYILHNGWSLFSFEPVCLVFRSIETSNIIKRGEKNKRIKHIYLIFQPYCNKLVMKKNAGRKVMSSPKQQVHNISFTPIVCFHVLTHAVIFWQTEYKPAGNKC